MNTGPHIRAVEGDETDPSSEQLVDGEGESALLSEEHTVADEQAWEEQEGSEDAPPAATSPG